MLNDDLVPKNRDSELREGKTPGPHSVIDHGLESDITTPVIMLWLLYDRGWQCFCQGPESAPSQLCRSHTLYLCLSESGRVPTTNCSLPAHLKASQALQSKLHLSSSMGDRHPEHTALASPTTLSGDDICQHFPCAAGRRREVWKHWATWSHTNTPRERSPLLQDHVKSCW